MSKKVNIGYVVGSTLVHTDNGKRSINEIQVGERVWSCDSITGEHGYKTVSDVYKKDTKSFVYIMFHTGYKYETIETTEESSFWTTEHGLVKSEELKIGDHLLLINGRTVKIESVGRAYTNKPVYVYALQVSEGAVYFIFDMGVLLFAK